MAQREIEVILARQLSNCLALPVFLADPEENLSLAEGADLLIHDAQYSGEECRERFGWATALWPRPSMMAEAMEQVRPSIQVAPGTKGSEFDLPPA